MSTENLNFDLVRKNFFHIYTVLAVVVFIIILFIANDKNDAVHAWARLPSWLSDSTVLSLFLLVSLVLAAMATTFASMTPKNPANVPIARVFGSNVSVGALFVVAGLLLVICALFAYKNFDFWPAFWSAALALVGVVLHFTLVWRMNRAFAYMVVPLMVFLVIALYYLWNMAVQSNTYENDSNYFDHHAVTYKTA